MISALILWLACFSAPDGAWMLASQPDPESLALLGDKKYNTRERETARLVNTWPGSRATIQAALESKDEEVAARGRMALNWAADKYAGRALSGLWPVPHGDSFMFDEARGAYRYGREFAPDWRHVHRCAAATTGAEFEDGPNGGSVNWYGIKTPEGAGYWWSHESTYRWMIALDARQFPPSCLKLRAAEASRLTARFLVCPSMTISLEWTQAKLMLWFFLGCNTAEWRNRMTSTSDGPTDTGSQEAKELAEMARLARSVWIKAMSSLNNGKGCAVQTMLKMSEASLNVQWLTWHAATFDARTDKENRGFD